MLSCIKDGTGSVAAAGHRNQGEIHNMSTQRKPEFIETELSEDAVRDFLYDNPDFFERHGALLDSLRLPHVAGGTVSLVERQVAMLRQKDLKLERKLKDLLEVARSNDTLAAKIHHLALLLLTTPDLQATLNCIEESLRTGFGADQAILVLFGDPSTFVDIDAGRFFRPIGRDDEALGPFSTFLKGTGPRCGQIRDAQREFLFGKDTDEVGSTALIRLGQKSEVGFLAIGSADADRFHPGMSVDFLTQLGGLITEALRRY